MYKMPYLAQNAEPNRLCRRFGTAFCQNVKTRIEGVCTAKRTATLPNLTGVMAADFVELLFLPGPKPLPATVHSHVTPLYTVDPPKGY